MPAVRLRLRRRRGAAPRLRIAGALGVHPCRDCPALDPSAQVRRPALRCRHPGDGDGFCVASRGSCPDPGPQSQAEAVALRRGSGSGTGNRGQQNHRDPCREGPRPCVVAPAPGRSGKRSSRGAPVQGGSPATGRGCTCGRCSDHRGHAHRRCQCRRGSWVGTNRHRCPPQEIPPVSRLTTLGIVV